MSASRKKTAYVVELKVAKKMEDLERKAEEALFQIADKMHECELRDNGYSFIIWYGIAFCGKDCAVKLKKK